MDPDPSKQASGSPLDLSDPKPAPLLSGLRFLFKSDISKAYGDLIPLSSRKITGTMILIVLNCLVYISMVYADRTTFWNLPIPTALKWGADYGVRSFYGEPWRFFTCMFLHSGLVHLALNMYYLYDVGQWTETLYGSTLYLWVYLAAGIGSSIWSAWMHPQVVGVGASGAVFAIVGALLAFIVLFKHKAKKEAAKKCLWSVVVLSFYAGRVREGVDVAAHMGGLVFGFVLGLVAVYDRKLASPERFAELNQPTEDLL